MRTLASRLIAAFFFLLFIGVNCTLYNAVNTIRWTRTPRRHTPLLYVWLRHVVKTLYVAILGPRPSCVLKKQLRPRPLPSG
jgi:hypothetical protein